MNVVKCSIETYSEAVCQIKYRQGNATESLA